MAAAAVLTLAVCCLPPLRHANHTRPQPVLWTCSRNHSHGTRRLLPLHATRLPTAATPRPPRLAPVARAATRARRTLPTERRRLLELVAAVAVTVQAGVPLHSACCTARRRTSHAPCTAHGPWTHASAATTATMATAAPAPVAMPRTDGHGLGYGGGRRCVAPRRPTARPRSAARPAPSAVSGWRLHRPPWTAAAATAAAWWTQRRLRRLRSGTRTRRGGCGGGGVASGARGGCTSGRRRRSTAREPRSRWPPPRVSSLCARGMWTSSGPS